ncbi:MAG TPA: DUF2939 domain-containing protein, partial [Geobacteraceae bacterium]|nr:DUF2939 domain-containing protein [Geobacteraceae bacterium]
MKKKIILLASFVILVIGYVASGPFITIYQIKSGLEQQDSEKLSDNIDFPTLRSNLKEQLNANMMQNVASELRDNPFSALAMGLASKMTETMVDMLVTPNAIRSMVEGKNPLQHQKDGKDPQESTGKKSDLFKNASFSFDGISKFSVRMTINENKEIRYVLTREGLSWKLSNIIIPLKDYTNIFEERENNALAKRAIKNAYVAAQSFFSDSPAASLTEKTLTDYGMKPSKDVTISVYDGTINNLRISAKHS